MANEKRLIDANAFGLFLLGKMGFNPASAEMVLQWMDEFKKKNTVDAVEVVHGRWMWEGRFKACSVCGTYIDMEDTLGASFWKYCPYCGYNKDEAEYFDNFSHFRYCPHCGAKMDGGNTDD